MIKESEAQPGKYGPEHEHRPGEQCPVSACTWPLKWTPVSAPQLCVMPLRPQLDALIQDVCASFREMLLRRGLWELDEIREAGIVKAGPLQPEAYTRTWPGLDVPVKEPHPEPLVRARPAREVEIPSAARTVRKLMEANGWRVISTYALGWVLGARGDVRSLTHTLALRAEHGDVMHPGTRMAVAVWACKEPDEVLAEWECGEPGGAAPPVKGWKFDMAYGWGAGQPQHKLSAAALKTYIKER